MYKPIVKIEDQIKKLSCHKIQLLYKKLGYLTSIFDIIYSHNETRQENELILLFLDGEIGNTRKEIYNQLIVPCNEECHYYNKKNDKCTYSDWNIENMKNCKNKEF